MLKLFDSCTSQTGLSVAFSSDLLPRTKFSCTNLQFAFLLFKGFVLWTILSFHLWNFLNRIFRVALLFICQGTWYLHTKRRRWDLNPCAAVNDLLPFQGSPFGQLGYFSKCQNIIYPYPNTQCKLWAERVGFEPTRPCGQTVFKTASLWPLRYLSIPFSHLSCRLISSARFIIYIVGISVNTFFKNILTFLLQPDYCWKNGIFQSLILIKLAAINKSYGVVILIFW